jgi:ubiquinone/menaquinone biosynthesis C-methylase UbiE
METPAAMAREGVHETVEAILRDRPRGSVLDVPTGHGALASRLNALGFQVSACDLYPELFELKDVAIRPGNLDTRLPYDDASFDHVVCIEGLEHIENPANAVREFSRLMKPGGTLVVSIPNIMNIEERLKWLFTGYTSHFKPLSEPVREAIGREYAGIEEAALHVSPIGYSEIRFLLETNGFEVERAHRDTKKKNAWLFLPIVGLIRLASKFTPGARRRERWTDEMNSDEVLLGGNTLIIQARKI